jgi:pathogenesis-related protein 1
MRYLVALLLLADLNSAQAQYPWWYQRYSGPYAAPAPGAPPVSLARAMLDAHNFVRGSVGVPPLVWSAQLASVAQDWANHLIAARGFAHRPGNRYGENLYAISGAAASPSQVVSAWVSERRGYDIRRNVCAGVCGHYTQVVWRTTRSVGCGVATDAERQVWVCDYDPPGNFVGERPY